MNQRSAAQLGRDIGAGRLDPVELTEQIYGRIAEHDPDAQIYARLTRERALHEATAARQRAKSGSPLSALDGVPVSWKDLFDTAGTATESGSLLLKDRVPDKDAEVLRRATEAGLVCIGKTHQTELAFSGLGINPKTATPPNRAMPGHCAGGSSSGAAASLAHELAAIAIGSDTAGSVRIPACWNNLVGLKTTHGALPLAGVVPLCPGFDTAGPLAFTVEDAALMFAILGGEKADLGDLPEISALNFLVAETLVLDNCDPAVIESFEAAIERLAGAGAKINRASVPEFAAAAELAAPIYPFEAWRQWGSKIEAHGEVMFAPVRRRFELGRDASEADYRAGQQEMLRLRAAWRAAHGQYDAVLTPSVAILPPSVEQLMADPQAFAQANLMTLRNSRLVSTLGLCALSLPLPQIACGLQLIGRANHDARLLQVGKAVEGALAT